MVDEIIANKSKFSRVIVDASSPGGTVTGYGLMFTEMERLRSESGLYITGVADDVAASGGMLQLLPSHEIVMPPYAMVGSIGVVTEFLNFHGLLKQLGIQPIELTAGEFKRTVTPFGDPTQEKRDHYTEQLKTIHRQFINSVTRYRSVDPDKVCNGDHWTAQEAIDKKLGLVDRLGTSRKLMFDANQDHDLVILSESSSTWERISRRFLVMLVDTGITQLSARLGKFGNL
jgi:serine protease SohB